jgi:hypothetical protein
MEALVVRDTQFAFSITDAVPGERIVGVNHIGSLAREIARVDGLVDDFKHTDGSISSVGMNALSHPLQEIGCSLVVCLVIESWI